MRVIAVDWSGALGDGGRSKIWLAEVEDGVLSRIENGRTREQLVSHLIDLVRADPYLVVGFDFAFSAPGWYLEQLGLSSGPALWQLAATQAEVWLRECRPPFWGRGTTRKPVLQAHTRKTDGEYNIGGIQPKSVFQIGGAGQVGTGSLRGWPHLATLQAAGFAVWPFDLPAWPLVLEIYPRLLTGRVVKSSAVERARYLADYKEMLTSDAYGKAASSEDAFDATISALAMAKFDAGPTGLPKINDRVSQLEGAIWDPDRAY